MALQFLGKGLKIDFFKGNCGTRPSGQLVETGVTDMLKANDNPSLERVTSFSSGIVDSCWWNSRMALAKNLFFSYYNVVSLLYRKKMRFGWTDDELSLHKDSVKSFKNIVKETFENF